MRILHKNLCLLMLLLIGCPLGMFAQNKTITGTVRDAIDVVIGASVTSAFVPGTTLGNPYLQWETQVAANVGLDLSMFNNRVNPTLEWYNNQANDLLMNCALPKQTGYANQYQNLGKMRNRGWEVTLNTVNIRNKHFQWTSDLNLSFNKSKVVTLDNNNTEKQFSVGDSRSGMVTYYAVVGERLGDMYGYVYEGVYTTDDFTESLDKSGNTVYTLKEGVVKPTSGSVQPGDIKYAADNEAGRQKGAADWYRMNPHRLHLGIIGLELGDSVKASDITDIRQTLDFSHCTDARARELERRVVPPLDDSKYRRLRFARLHSQRRVADQARHSFPYSGRRAQHCLYLPLG